MRSRRSPPRPPRRCVRPASVEGRARGRRRRPRHLRPRDRPGLGPEPLGPRRGGARRRAARAPAGAASSSTPTARATSSARRGGAPPAAATDVVFLAVGTGIGAGILSHGRLVRGSGGIAGRRGLVRPRPPLARGLRPHGRLRGGGGRPRPRPAPRRRLGRGGGRGRPPRRPRGPAGGGRDRRVAGHGDRQPHQRAQPAGRRPRRRA